MLTLCFQKWLNWDGFNWLNGKYTEYYVHFNSLSCVNTIYEYTYVGYCGC